MVFPAEAPPQALAVASLVGSKLQQLLDRRGFTGAATEVGPLPADKAGPAPSAIPAPPCSADCSRRFQTVPRRGIASWGQMRQGDARGWGWPRWGPLLHPTLRPCQPRQPCPPAVVVDPPRFTPENTSCSPSGQVHDGTRTKRTPAPAHPVRPVDPNCEGPGAPPIVLARITLPSHPVQVNDDGNGVAGGRGLGPMRGGRSGAPLNGPQALTNPSLPHD